MRNLIKADPMNPEWKKKWVDALRSGNYPRTTGKLCKYDDDRDNPSVIGYCCMGVGTHIFDPNHDMLRPWHLMLSEPTFDEFLPPDVARAFGFEMRDDTPLDPQIFYVGRAGLSVVTLSQLNDSDEYSFDMIADLIEYVF